MIGNVLKFVFGQVMKSGVVETVIENKRAKAEAKKHELEELAYGAFDTNNDGKITIADFTDAGWKNIDLFKLTRLLIIIGTSVAGSVWLSRLIG